MNQAEEAKLLEQLEQWNKKDEYSRCIRAIEAIPEQEPLIPAIQHQNIHHPPAAVGTGVLPCSANADGRFLASGSLEHRIAGIEAQSDSLALLVEGPASDLRIAGWIYIETLTPGPGISLQLQQSLHCLVISLHSKATHQVGGIP